MLPDFTPLDPIAYSYIRFSTPQQLKGDSLRRQTESALAWCQRNKARLDTTLTLHDLGTSAFTGSHRKNPDRNALAAFLRLVEQGKVTRGSYLIVESLDRLTREHIRPALTLLLNLIEAGIRIVQLHPVEIIYDENVEPMTLMMALMELSRGNSESRMKSERNGKAWQARLAKSRKGETVLTQQLPAWIEMKAGRLVLIPERAAAVRRIYELAAAGYGIQATIRKLIEENVQAFGERTTAQNENGEPEEVMARGKKRPRYTAGPDGRYGSGVWNRPYISLILRDRRALGEYQPCGKGRKPMGDPIPNYFPAVVTEAEWNAARSGARLRQRFPGRTNKNVNIFAGLLRDARDGDTMFFGRAGTGSKLCLINTAGAEGRAPYRSFQADVFERGILGLLRGIDPKEILAGVNGHNEVMELEAELGQVEASIAALDADLDKHGDSPTLHARLRKKEARKAELVPMLRDAREKAANPLSASWGEMQSLLDVLNSAPDKEDARTRLRAALRRNVESIQVLIVPRGRERFAAVQCWFTGGKCRNFVILNRRPQANRSRRREGGKWCGTLELVTDVEDLDLRRHGDVLDVEKFLTSVRPDSLIPHLKPME